MPKIICSTNNTFKKCSKCGKFKEMGHYHRDHSKSHGYQSECIECRKEYKREYYYKHHSPGIRGNYKRRWTDRESLRGWVWAFWWGAIHENHPEDREHLKESAQQIEFALDMLEFSDEVGWED